MHRNKEILKKNHNNRSVHAHWGENYEEKENVSCNINRRESEQRRKDSKMPMRLEREVKGNSPSNDKQQEYLRNDRKIEKLSCKLDELYQHFMDKSRKSE